jgi:branched-chain amino acid transport system ATP-binding protein
MFEAFELMVFFENMIALNNVSLTVGGQDHRDIRFQQCGKSTFMHAISGIILDIKKKERCGAGTDIGVWARCSSTERTYRGEPHIRAKTE